MKKILIKIFLLLVGYSIFFIGNSMDIYVDFINTASAATGDNILGKSTEDLRQGNITMSDIPFMIASAIEYILGIAGTICVVALIYHALQMQLASGITGDSSGVDKAKKGMKGALLGFVLAMSAWFLMTKLVALLASTTGG